MNEQPISKRDHAPDGSLVVVNVFYTIQGEGPYTGQPAVFVRLAGCNLRCPQCDTNYTNGAQRYSVEALVKRVRDAHTDGPGPARVMVVLTGGEPFRQNCGPFARALLNRGYRIIQVETNGTTYNGEFPLSNPRVTIVCSPKTPRISAFIAPHVQAWKYVLDANHVCAEDGLPTSSLGYPHRPARPPAGTRASNIYVQPLTDQDVWTGQQEYDHFGQMDRDAALASCLEFGYRYCHRVHLAVNME